jgi:ABC-type Fe3+-siderophore transport system permease subunit
MSIIEKEKINARLFLSGSFLQTLTNNPLINQEFLESNQMKKKKSTMVNKLSFMLT